MPQDRWPELCTKYAHDDGLPVRKVGNWTQEKLYFWFRYLEITTTAMVGHPKWPAGLVYVDLFGGPGICQVEGSGRRIPGSTLIAANAPKAFKSIRVSEMDAANASALESRLLNSPASNVFKVFRGDCNTIVPDLAAHIPNRALTLAFIDPENLNVDFSTVQTLARRGQVDLLILFADRMDLVRNVELYEQQNNSVVDRMMGPGSAWRAKWAALDNRSADRICRMFADEYKTQLNHLLGYKYSGEKVIPSEGPPLYRLIYASKNQKGLEFWNKVLQKESSGQMGLFP